MKACPECGRLTRRLVNGGLSPSELETYRRHAEACEECRQVLDVHHALGAAGVQVPEPPEAEFRRMRHGVWATIDARSHSRAGDLSRGWWLGSFAADARRFLRTYPAPAAIVLLIVIAASTLAGRWSAAPTRVDDKLLLSAIRHQTTSTAGLDGYWDEPLACVNVSTRSLSGDRLALSFDVSRHVELITPRQSDLAKGILVHAILEPAPMGARLKAMDVAEEVRDRRLEEAVIFTLARDPNPAVRLKALEVLARYPFDPSIQEALLATLREDPSPQMRLQALEYLAQQPTGPEILRRCIDEGPSCDDPVILQRAVELAREL
jgi:hypothetical protein